MTLILKVLVFKESPVIGEGIIRGPVDYMEEIWEGRLLFTESQWKKIYLTNNTKDNVHMDKIFAS